MPEATAVSGKRVRTSRASARQTASRKDVTEDHSEDLIGLPARQQAAVNPANGEVRCSKCGGLAGVITDDGLEIKCRSCGVLLILTDRQVHQLLLKQTISQIARSQDHLMELARMAHAVVVT